MKKVALGLLLLSAVLLSAVQPGLPASDVNFIKQFTLPAWSRINYELSISGNAYNWARSIKDYENNDSNFRRNERYGLNLNPIVTKRNESEKGITEYKGGFYSSFRYSSSRNTEDSPNKDIQRDVYLNPEISLNHKAYHSSKHYYNLETTIKYKYNHRYINEDSENNERLAEITTSAGYGIGKVRDVTPVIMALRFNKRYNSLGKGQLSDNEIGEIAKVIAKRDVYYSTYDKGNKYFWDAMYKAANGKMEGLSGYEAFMVMEGLGDLRGNRFQGSDFSLNAQYILTDENNSSDNSFMSKYEARYGVIAPIAIGRLYSNISIDYQIGFEGLVSYHIPISEEELYKHKLELRLNHNELYCITDRILYTGNLDFVIYDTEYAKDYTENTLATSLRNDLTFYIEDNVYLNLDADVSWVKTETKKVDSNYDEDNETLNWDFGVSLNYRFKAMN